MEERYSANSLHLHIACQMHRYDYREHDQWIGIIIRIIEGETIYNLFKNKQNDLYMELIDTAIKEVSALDAAYIYKTPQKWVFSRNEIFISVKFYLEDKE
ncbi:hypothetical protein GXP67_00495 [Rhodocytophaga rosea]|uniref:Uncharacterized protein n=1 Tax=Rhodocytophaga rosea TaxID=2704465 RepID=A0A6C0GBE1_9BACT|nr:hypothetical protein [Rhodocytophaga rosea]QHT65256.1 hypothetical protein GXP67_00495 [Rhodocytophaga rosea]